MSTRPSEAGSLKTGSFIVLDGEPCRIVEVERSKPGKHGSAKVRIVAIGFFDNVKRSFVAPVSARVEVPIINKSTAQVISVTPTSIQLMDLSTYEVYEVNPPEEEEIRSRLTPGVEVEVWEVMGRRKIMRLR